MESYKLPEVVMLRSELNNIRKQIQGLKFQHKKDVESLIKQFSELRNLKGDQPVGENCPKIEQKCSKTETSENTKASRSQSVDQFSFRPIGFVRSCHASKNGSPRQPSVSPGSRGTIDLSKMSERFNNAEYSLQNLEEFSHIWILFVFHLNEEVFVKTKVAPPRLMGKRVGIFSTRTPHRPNPIGLTLARLERISGNQIEVSGLDLVSGTPVLDIKPYIPKYDMPMKNSSLETEASEILADKIDSEEVRIPDWIESKPDLKVIFTARAEENLAHFTSSDQKLTHISNQAALRRAICDILSGDPRSNYRREKCRDRLYYFSVDNADVTCWFDFDSEQKKEVVEVLKIVYKPVKYDE